MASGGFRDYVGYGAAPPQVTWPGGRRVAVSLVINVEDGAERSTARGDAADDLRAHWPAHTVPPGGRNLTLESAFDYGARAGIWRILRVLREYDARATAFCCAEALDANPAIAAALLRDGHEIANHGLRWETHTNLSRDDERRRIAASTASLAAHAGARPDCWYSRDGISPWTHESLVQHGYRYDSNSFCDDVPYLVEVGDGALTVVPYAGDTNDSALLKQFRTGADFAAYLCDSLETLVADTRPQPSVLSVGLHPRLIGRPAYGNALRTFLRAARECDAWIARRAEIASHWRACIAPDSSVPQP